MTYLIYRTYQILVVIPVVILSSAWAGTTMAVMCTLTGWLRKVSPISLGILTRPDWWGTFASRWWGKIIIRISLLPVEVKGRENIRKDTSYVFVANHQGAYDILLVCGYLGTEIRWMMKRALEKVPFLGMGCKYAGYVFVDHGSAGMVRATYRRAENALKDGASLMVFPEGSRSIDGTMGTFKKGAFKLADELQLPVVPITINGSFDVMPKDSGVKIHHHKLSLTIHKPITPIGKGDENISYLLEESRRTIAATLSKQK